MISTRFLSGLVLLLVDGLGELVEIDVECLQKREEGVPADTAVSVLHLRDVCGADVYSCRERLLGERGLFAQFSQRLAEDAVGVGIWLCSVTGGRHRSATFTVGLSCARLDPIEHTYKLAPAMRGSSGRRGTVSCNSRHASQATSQTAWLLARAVLPGPPTKGGTMSTNTQGVLSSLLNEDRPWTVEEMVREKGNRLQVVDAIAELDALGLLTRINKRVVCASRAAIHADRLSV